MYSETYVYLKISMHGSVTWLQQSSSIYDLLFIRIVLEKLDSRLHLNNFISLY